MRSGWGGGGGRYPGFASVMVLGLEMRPLAREGTMSKGLLVGWRVPRVVLGGFDGKHFHSVVGVVSKETGLERGAGESKKKNLPCADQVIIS